MAIIQGWADLPPVVHDYNPIGSVQTGFIELELNLLTGTELGNSMANSEIASAIRVGG